MGNLPFSMTEAQTMLRSAEPLPLTEPELVLDPLDDDTPVGQITNTAQPSNEEDEDFDDDDFDDEFDDDFEEDFDDDFDEDDDLDDEEDDEDEDEEDSDDEDDFEE
jgi:hypothetical protein